MGSQCEEPHHSLECIRRSDMYPRATLVCDDPSIQHIPFPLLYGENGLFLGRSAEGVVTLTNFRLHICQRRSFLNIPLRLIESVESRDLFYLVILCKDATTVRCKFSCNEDCQLWLKRMSECTGPPMELTKLFAFAFFSHGSEQEDLIGQQAAPPPPPPPLSVQASVSTCDQAAQLCVPLEEKYLFSFGKEVERMQFDTSRRKVWRLLQANEDYSLCPSYPRHHIVPAAFKDEQIKNVAGFRSGKRFPSVVWRDQRNGAVIVRCSQPEYGWLGWRNSDDELLFRLIPEACAQDVGLNTYHSAHHQQEIVQQPPGEEGGGGAKVKVLTAHKMLVIDCRSYSAAIANRAKGGGSECQDYYSNCEIRFMNMANIHSIRKSFQALRLLCSNFPDHNWLSSLEATKWLSHLGAILFSSGVVVSAVEDARPVLIHCSDGWDRTAQISSLAQLLLDPYYRTIQGFQWLAEREWLEFGHKFADRCGHAVGADDVNEQSPVFLQWLDCVYQISRQFPCHFQFNEAFLIKLVQHTYSCLFGTFLFNTSRERQKEATTNPSASVWTLLHPDNPKFHNPLYNPSATEVLTPDWSVHSLKLWSSVYLSNNSLKTSSAEEFAASVEQAHQVLTPDEEPSGLTKTRSCDNLTTLPSAHAQEGGGGASGGHMTRRSSDPNIGCGGDTLALLSKEVDGSQQQHGATALHEPTPDNSADIHQTFLTHHELTVAHPSCLTEPSDAAHAPEEKAAACRSSSQNGDSCRHEEEDLCPCCDDHAAALIVGVAENGQCSPAIGSSEEIPCSVPSSHHVSSQNCEPAVNGEAKGVVMVNGHRDANAAATFAEADTQTSDSGLLVNGNEDSASLTNSTDDDDCVGGDDDAGPLGALTVETKAIDSSTDTLTGSEDQALLLKSQQQRLLKNSSQAHPAPPPHAHPTYCNGDRPNGYFNSDGEEGEGEEERLLKGGVDERCDLKSLKLMIQKNCSISTSTSDISDSHVKSNNSSNGLASDLVSRAAGGLGLYIRCNSGGMCGLGGAGVGGRRTTPSSSEASPSVCSLVATPINSHTPPSTCSPTPGSEGKNSESPLVRQLNSVARHLDCDGLTTFVDPALERVQQMMRDYERRIVTLEYRLAATTAHLNQMMPLSNGAGRVLDPSDCMNFPGEVGEGGGGGGELSSLGTESNPASDVSWEQVDERDSRITLWVPDHVVTHCAGCGGSFWIGRRKHHCRNCGKVYCYTCSNFFAPVPTQHLAEPVRLCSSCYNQLHFYGPGGAASDDTRITVGAE